VTYGQEFCGGIGWGQFQGWKDDLISSAQFRFSASHPLCFLVSQDLVILSSAALLFIAL
jgi:hypothetical protein